MASSRIRSDQKAKQMVKRRLGTADPPVQCPDGYQSWQHYFTIQSKAPAPYKSWLEFRVFELGCLKGVPYEPESFQYAQRAVRTYTPDGVDGDVWYEVKGRFRTRDEANKYLDIRECHPNKEIIFIFSHKKVKFPGVRKRKDGSYFTHEDWCVKHNFKWRYE